MSFKRDYAKHRLQKKGLHGVKSCDQHNQSTSSRHLDESSRVELVIPDMGYTSSCEIMFIVFNITRTRLYIISFSMP